MLPTVVRKKTRKANLPGVRDADSEVRVVAEQVVVEEVVVERLVRDVNHVPCVEPDPVEQVVVRELPVSVEAPLQHAPLEEEAGDSSDKDHGPAHAEDSPVSSDDSSPRSCSRSTLQSLLDRETFLHEDSGRLTDERVVLQAQIAALVSMQNAFCDEENFDEADRVDRELAQVREALFEVDQQLLLELPRDLERVQTLISEHLVSILAEEQKQLQASESEATRRKETLRAREVELEVAILKSEKIDIDFAALETSIEEKSGVVAENTARVEARILEETESVEIERRDAEQMCIELDAQVADLQRQLATAMEERSECAKIISAASLQLGSVRSQFREELEGLEADMAAVDAERLSVVEKKLALGGGRTAELISEMETVQAELSMPNAHSVQIDQLAEQEKCMQSRNAHLAALHAASAAVRPLRADLVDAGDLVRLLGESLSNCEIELDRFKSKLVKMKDELPGLESEKQSAIAGRAFREAKELTEQIKQFNEQLAAAESTVATLKRGVGKARKDWLEACEGKAELEQKLGEAEILFASHKDELLAARAAELQASLSSCPQSGIVRTILEAELIWVMKKI